MTGPERKIVQHLSVAHSTELALVQTLTAHIGITPRGSYRSLLERHLGETRDHAARVERRLGELGAGRSPIQAGLALIETAVGQVLAVSKAPIDMLRGTSAEEKLLRNARDECATEGFEIGAYTALEHVASAAGDDETAELAAAIRADEERMLLGLQDEIPGLAEAVARAELGGMPAYDPTTTGAADAARAAGRAARAGAGRAAGRATESAKQARRVPGVEQAEGEVKGAMASEEALPISAYGSKTAAEIVAALPELSQVDLGKVDAYERRHDNRTTILQRIDALRGSEPWTGYDEQSVEEIRNELSRRHAGAAAEVREYERRHKGRSGVIEATEREAARA